MHLYLIKPPLEVSETGAVTSVKQPIDSFQEKVKQIAIEIINAAYRLVTLQWLKTKHVVVLHDTDSGKSAATFVPSLFPIFSGVKVTMIQKSALDREEAVQFKKEGKRVIVPYNPAGRSENTLLEPGTTLYVTMKACEESDVPFLILLPTLAPHDSPNHLLRLNEHWQKILKDRKNIYDRVSDSKTDDKATLNVFNQYALEKFMGVES